MAKMGANIRSFTVGTPGDPADESQAARETARTLGIPHEVIELAPGQQPELDELIDAYGEPFACSSALGMLRVSRAVRERATVLLTGDGGDDVYLGYPYHARFLVAQRLARLLPGSAAAAWPAVRPAVSRIAFLRRPMHLMDFATAGLAGAARAHDGLPWFEREGLPGPGLEGRIPAVRAIPDSRESAKRLLADFLAFERGTRFVSEYLTKVDGGTMYYAIEARSPFLDQRVWESAASMRFEVHLRGGELKAVLRELVRRRVGPAVAARRKQGFTVPVERWLATTWRPQLERLTSGMTRLESEGFIAPGKLSGAVAGALERGRAPRQIWSLIVLEQWLRARP
jgi:asparagine synthase (glutamine-hydrolysing)